MTIIFICLSNAHEYYSYNIVINANLEVGKTRLTSQIELESVLFQRSFPKIKLSINLFGSKSKFINFLTKNGLISKFGLNFQLESKLIKNSLVMINICQYLISRNTDMNDIPG